MRRLILILAVIVIGSGMASRSGGPQETPVASTPAAADMTVKEITPPVPSTLPPIDPSIAHETEAAIGSSLDWLASKQREDGSWSDANYPALTALPLWAFARSQHPKKKEIIDKAVKFILSCRQPDGGFYKIIKGRRGGGLSNYNTAICMTALHATGRRKLTKHVQDARAFIVKGQHMGDDTYRGGFGYDWATDRAYTDLMNTAWATEAMRRTEDVEELRAEGEEKVDIDWKAAQQFLARLQENAEEGGFPYRPDESKAGQYTNTAGKVVLRSYGSMTYAGMLAMIYSDVPRTDPRVKSAFDWAANHWTLEENPGMGRQGLYWFYHIITKAMSAYGDEKFKTQTGAEIAWRIEVTKKLLSLKKTDDNGRVYWLNETARFMESDAILTTAYTLLALQIGTGL